MVRRRAPGMYRASAAGRIGPYPEPRITTPGRLGPVMMLVYFLQTALPLILILWLAVLPPKSRAGFWMLVLASALLTFAAARLGIWVFPPWWVPYLLALILVAAVLWRLIWAPQRPPLPSGALGWLALIIIAGIAGSAGLQSGAAIIASRMPNGPSTDLAWPLGPGLYLVVNGGASASNNARAALLDPAQPLHAGFGGSGYGVDLIAVNDWGFRTGGIMPADPAGYQIFGTPVLAPCAGRVVLAEGGRPDMAVPQMDEGHPAGNHVLLRCGDHDILLAHFRQGSLRMEAGDDLAIGQQIAEVGNSGESSEPHLHIHAQMPGTPDAPFGGAPVPMRLEARFLVRGDVVQAGALGQ